jgi:glycosyltransferase involved in cell wall biosynthesis
MLISVIITCYNLEKYIADAIDSVVTQDVASDKYEVIVVDDCSTDRSAEIIHSYENVHYCRTKNNCGVLLATILGLESSSGELVFFWMAMTYGRAPSCRRSSSDLMPTPDWR